MCPLFEKHLFILNRLLLPQLNDWFMLEFLFIAGNIILKCKMGVDLSWNGVFLFPAVVLTWIIECFLTTAAVLLIIGFIGDLFLIYVLRRPAPCPCRINITSLHAGGRGGVDATLALGAAAVMLQLFINAEEYYEQDPLLLEKETNAALLLVAVYTVFSLLRDYVLIRCGSPRLALLDRFFKNAHVTVDASITYPDRSAPVLMRGITVFRTKRSRTPIQPGIDYTATDFNGTYFRIL